MYFPAVYLRHLGVLITIGETPEAVRGKQTLTILRIGVTKVQAHVDVNGGQGSVGCCHYRSFGFPTAARGDKPIGS